MSNPVSSERYFRIVRVGPDGKESPLRACLPDIMAQSFVTGYNVGAVRRGFRAEPRELDSTSLSRLAGNSRR
jgi:hypothetical protein